jgi:hypothetical protein
VNTWLQANEYRPKKERKKSKVHEQQRYAALPFEFRACRAIYNEICDCLSIFFSIKLVTCSDRMTEVSSIPGIINYCADGQGRPASKLADWICFCVLLVMEMEDGRR